VPVAAATGAWASVVVAALVFVGLYAVGGAAPVPLDALVAAMGTWHLVIGLGEAAITFLVVSTLVAARPDLVHGARPVLREPRLVVTQGARP
jgi:cobalt/nickel transport system permease protein